MSVKHRLQTLEKIRGTGTVVACKEAGESDEEAMERYIAEHGEKLQGVVVFLDPLDIKACTGSSLI